MNSDYYHVVKSSLDDFHYKPAGNGIECEYCPKGNMIHMLNYQFKENKRELVITFAHKQSLFPLLSYFATHRIHVQFVQEGALWGAMIRAPIVIRHVIRVLKEDHLIPNQLSTLILKTLPVSQKV